MTGGCDVAVIGGGPAGAAVAGLLAHYGHHVMVFEQERFPRFHVGESLVPAVNITLERLGVLHRMESCRFPKKNGVQFFSPKGPSRPFYFDETSDPRMQHTWQVLRSDFDALLLDRAEQLGVEVRTGVNVRGVLEEEGAVCGVRTVADGVECRVRSRLVIDASGTNGVLARAHGEREVIADLMNTAVFAHYRDARLDAGRDAGSTLIYRLEGRPWLWFIPLPDGASVGLVAPADTIGSFGDTPEAILDRAIAQCPLLCERLCAAERTTEVLPVRDFTYRATVDGGPGWLLVGDALGFIDPMYSTGLFLAMYSAELATGAADLALQKDGIADMAGFSRDYQHTFDQYLCLVRAFYDPDFHFGEMARNPRKRQGLVDLLTGIVGTQEAAEVTRYIDVFFDRPRETTACRRKGS